MIKTFLEGTRCLEPNLPEYRRRYFMVWSREVPDDLVFNKVYKTKINGQRCLRVYVLLKDYGKDENTQELAYRQAMRRARSLLGLPA